MTVSSLADSVMLSPNYTQGRWNVTRLTPHHTACIATAEQIAAMFQSTSRQASCNYAIGYDGSICCVVDENNRAWTSSSYDNDMQAITFEISDCNYDWEISKAAQEAYINLCVDLIRRYPSLGGSYNWTGDLDGNVTLHRWFAATECPAQPMIDLQDYFMKEINRRLNGKERFGVPMECILHPDESGTLFYVCGTNITHLDMPDNQKAVNIVAEDCGIDLPYVEIGSAAAPWGFRFFQACGQEALYRKWIWGEDIEQPEQPAQPVQPNQPVQPSIDLSAIGNALVQLGNSLIRQ